jgi:hypothetical protein
MAAAATTAEKPAADDKTKGRTDTPAPDSDAGKSLDAKEQDAADKSEVGHAIHQFYVKDGGQSVGDIAEEVLGGNTPENRHHIWDWNRNQVSSPEATVPGGNILRIVEPGKSSGGPTLNTLKASSLTDQDLQKANEVPGMAGTLDGPKVNRAVSRDMTPGKGTAGSTVAPGSDGAEAQARQDARRQEGGSAGDDGFAE